MLKAIAEIVIILFMIFLFSICDSFVLFEISCLVCQFKYQRQFQISSATEVHLTDLMPLLSCLVEGISGQSAYFVDIAFISSIPRELVSLRTT